MSEIVRVVKRDKERVVIKEFDYELPTSFEELEIIPGKDKALSYVRNQMKIMARALGGEGKPRKPGKGKLLKEIEAAGITMEELLAYVREKKAAA